VHVSGSVCLNAEKIAPFVNIFHMSFPFGIDFDIVERRLSFYVSVVLPIARDWASVTGLIMAKN